MFVCLVKLIDVSFASIVSQQKKEEPNLNNPFLHGNVYPRNARKRGRLLFVPHPALPKHVCVSLRRRSCDLVVGPEEILGLERVVAG